MPGHAGFGALLITVRDGPGERPVKIEADALFIIGPADVAGSAALQRGGGTNRTRI